MEARKKEIVELFHEINQDAVEFGVVSVGATPSEGIIACTLSQTDTDLKRFEKLTSEIRLTIKEDGSQVQHLGLVPAEGSRKTVCETTSPSGLKAVRVRKSGEKTEELWIETWDARGYLQSLKIQDKTDKVFNDSIFGKMEWNKDETKVCFIGNVPNPKSYKNMFDPPADANADTVFDDVKFSYQQTETFGETMDGKINPAIFVYDLDENQLRKVINPLQADTYPQCPRFDEEGGVLVQGIHLPLKRKFGLSFCLNRYTYLYHIETLCFDEKENPQDAKNLTSNLFLAFGHKFSKAYDKVLFIGRETKFISHSANYEMFVMNWKTKETRRILDRVPVSAAEDEFAGLYGYRFTFDAADFVDEERFIFQSPCHGRNRIYLVNLSTKKVKWINVLGQKHGEYTLLNVHNHMALVQVSSFNKPPSIHAVFLNNNGDNDTFSSIELVKRSVTSELPSKIVQESVTLTNGADAAFLYNQDFKDKPMPLVVVIHGGPFSASPLDGFFLFRNCFLSQGYALLVVNYRGSIGYGEQFLDALLGEIGVVDVEDCGELVRTTLNTFPDIIDKDRIGLYGGSHGGFLTGSLIGHKTYGPLFKCAAIWNGVLDMSFMITATDIPDWIQSCCQNKDFETFQYDAAENQVFFERSPISVLENISVPTLLLVGTADRRVPPSQSIYFYHALKAQGVPVEMFCYPDSGHALAPTEHNVNANLNILFFFDKYMQK